MIALDRRQLLRAAAIGGAAVALQGSPLAAAATATATPTAVGLAGDPMGLGYWLLMSDGSVTAHGTAQRTGGVAVFRGVATGVAAFPTGGGFWRVRRNGAVTGVGRATLKLPSIPDRRGAVVGIASNPRGDGLWRVTSRGMVVGGGAAPSLGQPTSAALLCGIAAHPEAVGYWILNRRGRVFSYGACRTYGTPAGAGAVAIAAHPNGDGYWVAKSDGTVGAFGNARHYGNAALGSPVTSITASADGDGYWVTAANGRVAAFGTARTGLLGTTSVPQPALATVGGITVAADISKRLGALLRHAADDKINFGGYGYRSYTRQVELRRQNCGPRYFDVYIEPSGECSPPTATPGRSMHEKGLAIDFHRKRADGSIAAIAGTEAFTWLKRNAATYGLYNLPSEPWHWSTTGG